MSMSGFGGQQLYHVQADRHQNIELQPNVQEFQEIQNAFGHFIKSYQINNIFKYRNQLLHNHQNQHYCIKLEIEDLVNARMDMIKDQIVEAPSKTMILLEDTLKTILQSLNVEIYQDFQIEILTFQKPQQLRDLDAKAQGQLVVVEGIVSSASKPAIKTQTVCIKCKNCGSVRFLKVPKGLQGVTIPRRCANQTQENQCPLDPYQIIPQQSQCVNSQLLKLQELPEKIPSGEVARNMQLWCDRYLVDRVCPGGKVKIIGIYSNYNKGQKGQNIKNAYIQALGIMNYEKNGLSNSCFEFTEEEKDEFNRIAKQPNVYELIWKSIGSSIFGNDDIKKAIACQLFGGSRKILPDKTKLRGDINILLLGDPSTGKSQFLKMASKIAPISVYTSGKGSSAAGLTAAVIKDSSGLFQLEGGAMVLADNGLVCIDEFDKMNPYDRVSIHEAMEQQTISIAKAGITTQLNSRCSVLAAANPIFGSYQESISSEDQIDFQSTILSRFDCIFMVRDIMDQERDKQLAKHIMDLFINQENKNKEQQQANQDIIDPVLLRKYIAFCRQSKKPRLTQEAAGLLQNYYIQDRKEKKTKIPITVRQLEAIVRLSEAIAKMHLLDKVDQEHVEEAHRIFSVSTLNFATFNKTQKTHEMVLSTEMVQQIKNIEERIISRIPVGGKIGRDRLVEEMLNRCGNMMVVEHAILNLLRSEKLQQREGMKVIYRNS